MKTGNPGKRGKNPGKFRYRYILVVLPTAASIYKLFLFVILWQVDTSVKEFVGFDPIYPEPNINLEL